MCNYIAQHNFVSRKELSLSHCLGCLWISLIWVLGRVIAAKLWELIILILLWKFLEVDLFMTACCPQPLWWLAPETFLFPVCLLLSQFAMETYFPLRQIWMFDILKLSIYLLKSSTILFLHLCIMFLWLCLCCVCLVFIFPS